MSIIKVLELYSGIGGMHYSIMESGVDFEVVAAVDINTTANAIYQHNFPHTKLLNRCIESISLKEWEKLGFDMILMSPPCQPYCRVGKQQDITDERTKSFLSLLEILPRLSAPPSYILVENVKGFDTSKSRQLLLDVLNSMQYNIQEFLLSPLQFGIPNSRLRYYLIAKKKPLAFNFETKSNIREDIPNCVDEYLIHRKNSPVSVSKDSLESADMQSGDQRNVTNSTCSSNDKTVSCHTTASNNHNLSACGNSVKSEAEQHSNLIQTSQSETLLHCGNNTNSQSMNQSKDLLQGESSTNSQCVSQHTGSCDEESDSENDNQAEVPFYKKYKSICGNIGEYLEKEGDECFEQYLIPEKFFKRFWVMDIVNGESRNSTCFTKRYARHIEGSPIIQMNNRPDEQPLSYYKTDRVYNDTVHEAVRSKKLRFFSPREIANILCFPQSFCLPAEMSNIQCYRVLGNSLNVHVVSVLIRLMLT